MAQLLYTCMHEFVALAAKYLLNVLFDGTVASLVTFVKKIPILLIS